MILKRIQNHYYQQRILILLAPLLLLAVVIWFFDRKNTPFLDANTRQMILHVTNTLLPGVLALLITLIVPIKNRSQQLTTTACAYLILVYIMHHFTYNDIDYTIICTISAASNVLVFLSKSSENNKVSGTLIRWCLALFVPILIAILIYSVLAQINIFIKAIFNSNIINTNYSFIIVPLFTVLQAFGCHNELNMLINSDFKPSINTAFHNTILITNFVVLPVAIFMKSLFTQNTLRIFLIFLGACCILCASIGTSLSFILIFLLIFFPGTFFSIILSEIMLFFISLHCNFSSLIRSTNFYRPDINLSYTNIFYNVTELKIFAMLAIILPITLLLIFFNTSITNLEYQRDKRKRKRFNYDKSLDPDLQVIVLLRALGGIDNIKFIKLQDNYLFIHVYNQQEVSYQTLASMCRYKKAGFDKVKKAYRCNFGLNNTILHDKLIKLLGDFLGQSFQEISLAPAFIIPKQ